MAGFDPSLDKELFAESVTVGIFRLSAKVMSYNDGQMKLQLVRERMNKDGEPGFAKLGRLTLQEAQLVLPLYQKAIKYMEENSDAEE